MRLRVSVAVLRDLNYRRLFAGQTASLIGDGIAPVAIAFAVLDLTGSASDLGLVLASRSLLIAALIIAGGVFADRISPRLAMLRADLLRFVAIGVMAALLIADVATIWQLALLYALEGAGTALFNPASNALLPLVVGPAQRQDANGLLNLSGSLGKTIGPALAGILLALGTPGWALAFDALTFLVSAAFLVRLRTPPPSGAPNPSFAHELREGWAEFSRRTWLWACVLGAAIVNAVFFPAFQVLGPTVAEASLGGSSAWALIAAAFGLGALLGGLLALAVRPRRPLLLTETTAALLVLPIALLAIPAATALIAAGALLAGAALAVAEVIYTTAFQQHIPAAVMSRVSAYDWFGSLAIEPLGFALVGAVAAGLGTSPVLWGSVALIALCQAAVLTVPSVRRLGPGPALAPGEPVILAPVDPGD